MASSQYAIEGTSAETYNGQEFTVITYTYESDTNPYARGASAEKMAETCVDLLLAKDRSNIPALVCLPVSYAPGGTTRE